MDRLETGLPGLIREHRNAWIVVAIVTVLRLVLIGQVGLGDDEAYYWEWSRRLSSSYYDHPPVVGRPSRVTFLRYLLFLPDPWPR